MIKRLVVGISGATGSIYGVRMLEVLRGTEVETHLVMSEAAEKTIQLETDFTVEYVKGLADVVYDINNVGGTIASGSFETMGMVVIPCSIKTLSGIANSFNVNLLIRAADVTLKEQRRLVLMVRETPFHKCHLRLMLQATESGAVIAPPIPAFYKHPRTITELIDQAIGRILGLLQIMVDIFERWDEEDGARSRKVMVLDREQEVIA